MNEVERTERKLIADRSTFFRGTARIRFQHLRFIHEHDRKRDDEKLQRDLKNRYKIQGCLRLEPKHHIPALIDQRQLDDAIRISERVDQKSLLDNPKPLPPELKFPAGFSVECLQGHLRVQAAKEFLARQDWWWTVDLYLKDGSSDLESALADEYANSVNFSDGEIYLKLRQYGTQTERTEGTIFAEKCMMGRLSNDKRNDFLRLLKHKSLVVALDALRPFPGLWYGFQLGHKWMKLVELVVCYLHQILNTLKEIFGDKKQLFGSFDRYTAHVLQSRAPGISSEDSLALATSFEKGQLFSSITDLVERQMLWTNLQKITTLIPTFYTLFEDIKYLDEPAKIMKQLFGIFGKTNTIKEEMYHKFTNENLKDGEFFIQVSKNSFRRIECSPDDQFELGFLEVWLGVFREWTNLGPGVPRKEAGEEKPVPQTSDPKKWYELAALARRSGFESDMIRQLLDQDPDRKSAKDFLLVARPPEDFEYDARTFESFIAQISDMLKSATEKQQTRLKPSLLVFGTGETLERRCGRTFSNAWRADRKHLFLDTLYHPQRGEGGGVSSFLVRSSVFFNFFGRYDLDSSNIPPNVPQAAKNVTMARSQEASLPTAVPSNAPQVEVQRASASPDGRHDPPLPPIAESRELLDDDDLFEEDELDEEGRDTEARVSTAVPLSIDNSVPVQNSAAAAAAATPREDIAPPIRASTTAPRKDDLTSIGTSIVTEDDNSAVVPEPTPLRVSVRYWQDGKLLDQESQKGYEREEIERLVKKSLRERKGFNIFNIKGRALTEKNFFDAVINDGTRTIVLSRDKEIAITRRLIATTEGSVQNNQAATDLLSEIHAPRSFPDNLLAQGRSLGDMSQALRIESDTDTDTEGQQNRTKRREIQQFTSLPTAVQKTQKRVTRIDFNNIIKAAAPRTAMNHESTEQTLPRSDVQDPPALTTTTLQPSTEAGLRMQQKVDIHFKMKEHGIWKLVHSLSVDPSDTMELQRLVIKYMRKREPMYPYTKDMRMVKVGTCFEDAIADGENTLYLIPAGGDTDGGEFYAAQPPKKLQQLETKIRIEGPLQLDLLKNDLRSRDKIIIVSGAGISTNAGVADFRSTSGTKMSSKRLFHVSVYSDPQAAEQLHNVLLKTFESASKPEFTPLEAMMETLAKSGRIQRHYTQNIDCRTARLPSLAEKTVWLHGRLDKLRCHINPEHTKEVNPESFPQWILQACPMCEETNEKRRADNKRPRSVGFFRTDVLLYDERSPHESEIEAVFESDLKQPVDTIIIVGTRLEINSLRTFVKDVCRSAERAKRDVLTIWVSKERQKYGQSLGFVLNYEYIGDCDEFASLLLEEPRKS